MLKEQEKADNYNEVRGEVKKIWNLSQVVCGCSGCKWSPSGDIKNAERLAEEVKCKE